jgi:phage gp46-like protein
MGRFDGDPKLYLTPNGSKLVFSGGQPHTDEGIENAILIALNTKKGWWGNDIVADSNKKIGSDYISETEKPITINSIANIDKAAVKALDDPLFGEVISNAQNTESYRIDNVIEILPPGFDSRTLLLNQNGANWLAQRNNPAHRKGRQ